MRETDHRGLAGLRQRGKEGLGTAFRVLQRVGIDVLPRHFYSGIPDIKRLRSTERWRAPRSMVGVGGANLDGQVDFAREILTQEITARLAASDPYAAACADNGAIGYGPVEADFLYAFIAAKRPPRVVQVGAGVSTSVILGAGADAGYAPEVIAIDPYPTDYLRRAPITLIEQDAQDVPIERLAALRSGDLLFVDSTHTVKTDSEVNWLVLEILPRLVPGVWVHFHDIYFPYDYQRDILSPPLFFWLESTLIHAFLIGNPGFRIAASMAMLHYGAPADLQRLIPRYVPQLDQNGLGLRSPQGHFPSSLYLVREDP